MGCGIFAASFCRMDGAWNASEKYATDISCDIRFVVPPALISNCFINQNARSLNRLCNGYPPPLPGGLLAAVLAWKKAELMLCRGSIFILCCVSCSWVLKMVLQTRQTEVLTINREACIIQDPAYRRCGPDF